MTESKKIICYKPGPQWPVMVTESNICIHDFEGLVCRMCGYYASPVNCSHAGHDTTFNRSRGDECRSCGVEW